MGLVEKVSIESAEDVFDLLKNEMCEMKQECFKVILLDPRNKVTKYKTIALGTLDSSIVHPRDIFRFAIINNAASIILVHNHPAGDPAPSEEDLFVTRNIMKSGSILGIEVKDHVIIGNSDFISLKEENY